MLSAHPAVPSSSPSSDRARGRYLFRVWGGYAVAVLLYAGLMQWREVQQVPDDVYLVGVLVAALCMLPLALWYTRNCVGMPMFELICLSYGLQYSVPVFTQPNQILINSVPFSFTWHETLTTLLLTAIGLIAMIGAYYGVKSLRWSRRLPSPDLKLDPQLRSRYIYASLIVGLGMQVLSLKGVSLNSAGPLGALTWLLTNQVFVALSLLAAQLYRSGGTLRQRMILIGAMLFAALLGLIGGLLQDAFLPLIVVLVTRWYVKRTLPLAWLAIAAIVFLLLNGVKDDYRRQVWFSGQSYTIQDRITLWISDLGDELNSLASGSSSQTTQTSTVQAAASRTDLLHIFSLVHTLTPGEVPYYQGQTYSYFLVAWIPRFVWPDKPVAQSATTALAIDYHLLGPGDTSTSIGIGHLPEAYANFGLAGIIAVMALEGAFFAIFGTILNERGDEVGQAIYLSLMVYGLDAIGADTTFFFGRIIQTAVAAVVVARFAARRRGASSAADTARTMPVTREKGTFRAG